jgi:hypothetical protein
MIILGIATLFVEQYSLTKEIFGYPVNPRFPLAIVAAFVWPWLLLYLIANPAELLPKNLETNDVDVYQSRLQVITKTGYGLQAISIFAYSAGLLTYLSK